MVYYGRPSKGCDECRARKIRCDQGKPACRQCIESKHKCPGYRDLSTVLFRDETKAVVRKANKPPRPRRQQKLSTSPASVELEVQSRSPSTSACSSPGSQEEISLVIEPSQTPGPDEGICFFFSRFSWEAASLFFNEFKTVSSTSSSTLMAGMSSIGLAMMSSTKPWPALKMSARSSYTSTLQLINAALSNKAEATSDAILATIILLSFFETVTCKAGSKTDWLAHTSGATALLSLRGSERLTTPAEIHMFLEWKGQLLTGCLQNKTFVPSVLMRYDKLVTPLRPPIHQCDGEMASLTAEVANLRAAIHAGHIEHKRRTLSTAYSIEAKIERFKTSIPASWEYHVVQYPDPDTLVDTVWGPIRLYNGSYHIYPDMAICVSLNFYRVSRILVNEVILDCLRCLKEETEPNSWAGQCNRTIDMMVQLAADIYASAPGILGIPGKQQADLFHGTALGGYALLLPLYTAGRVKGYPHPLRLCAIEILKLIAYNIGIGHAAADINLLQHEKGITDWWNESDRINELIG
ncbi:hypothetical protein F5884DRAFT_85215 [Xylogone sp. PMI_703]|nr:hypothetical protein F5884DRAFT_85215 [Xylogone sp. PMI_703]